MIKRTVINNLNEVRSKRSKYGNHKITFDGHEFDSKAEAAYYRHLKLLQAGGVVDSFKMQVSIPLLDNFKHPITGKKVRGIKYIADFEVIYSNGSVQVVDVKGKRTEAFNIKAKLFLERYQVPLVLAKLNYRTNEFEHEEVYG